MANYNPNTSGLVSLADRPDNERTTIQSQGGVVSGQKRREIKRIADIVYGIRKANEYDPVVDAVKSLFGCLQDISTKPADILRILYFLKDIEPEFRPEPQKSSVGEMLALRNYLATLGNDQMPAAE